MKAEQDDLFAGVAPPLPTAPQAGNLHACRCEVCCPENPGPTYTEAFRHECEARYVAGLPSDDRRREYLGEVYKARDFVAYARLRSAAWNLMQVAGA